MMNTVNSSPDRAVITFATSTRTSMVRRDFMTDSHGRDLTGQVMEDLIYIAPCRALAGRLPRMAGPARE